MSKRILVIEGDDQGHFFLSVQGGSLTVGDGPDNTEAVLRGLHISRIHCEVEIDEDFVVVSEPANAVAGNLPSRQALLPGEDYQLPHARLHLQPIGGETGIEDEEEDAPELADDAPAEPPAMETPAEPESAVGLVKQLRVIDGADQ